jgi:hypothetical protein
VSEGRIDVAPWIERVDGQTVHFTDGTSGEFDVILFGTGFEIDLPFLGDDVRHVLDMDAKHADLHAFTFHPDLPGLAFVGLFELIGPYFPVLELQARWLAYTWGGVRPAPTREEMDGGVRAYRERRGMPQELPMHAMALLFARQAGVEPDLAQWPSLTRALMFGPLSPSSFRLSGPDRLPDAMERTAAEAASFGAVPDAQLTPEQQMQLQALAGARGDEDLNQLVDRLATASSALNGQVSHSHTPVTA